MDWWLAETEAEWVGCEVLAEIFFVHKTIPITMDSKVERDIGLLKIKKKTVRPKLSS